MLAHRTTLGAWLDATVSAVDADADNLTLEYDDDSIEAVPATSCLQVPSRYGVGQAVVARMTDTADAEWLAGTICDVQPDGSYSVQYEDGDIDTDVPSTRLRAPACGEQGAQYSVGDRTLGRTPGGRQWFAGQVTRVVGDNRKKFYSALGEIQDRVMTCCTDYYATCRRQKRSVGPNTRVQET